MCGRFNIDFEDSKEIEEILQRVDQKVKKNVYPAGYHLKAGDIYPTSLAPILREDQGRVEPELSQWGFPNYNRKGVIINARSETAFQKSMFRTGMMSRRCVIPSTGFYEWDSNKKQYFIRRPGTSALYMAGIYNLYDDGMKFVVLTTAANASMEVIHHRMPVILSKDQIQSWLYDEEGAKGLMLATMPQVELKPVEKEFEQLSLF